MTIQQSRKALKIAIKAKERTDSVRQIIAHANGDGPMIEAAKEASDKLEFAIRRLCNIVPNADILYEVRTRGPLLPGATATNVAPGHPLIMPASAGHIPPLGRLKPSWCDECERPMSQCGGHEDEMERGRR